MIVSTEDQSDRVLQTYIPILPKHIWGKMDYKAIGDAKFEPPADGSGLVGTGPYLLNGIQAGPVRPVRPQPNYWGPKGAADEVILQIFGTNDTMVQALKKGEIDYARNVSADQLKALKNEPDIVGVNGASNGWTELGFNTYGTGTGKTIKGGGPSTKALLDPAFRDALGYAIDKQKLIDNVLGGYGTIGSTQVRRSSPSGTSTPRRRARSISSWPSRSSTPPATSSTRRGTGSTRRASRSTSGWSCRTTTRTTPRRASSSRTGSASSGSRWRPRSTTWAPWWT